MKKLIIIAAVFLFLGYLLGAKVQASAPLPGGPDDPVITRSYLEQSLSGSNAELTEQLSYMRQQVKDLEDKVAALKEKIRMRIVLTLGSKIAYIGSQSRELEVAPYMENGRTMLPFRFIGEALGAEVAWNDKDSSVAYRLNGREIVLKIGSAAGTVNGQGITLDVPPLLLRGRTMVPVRVVSEYLGAAVNWNADLQQVTIIPSLN